MSNEVKTVIDSLGQAFEEFKSTNEEKISSLRNEIDDLAKKSGRILTAGNEKQTVKNSDFRLYLKSGQASPEALKAMQTGNGPDGGYAVPKEIAEQIENMQSELSPVRQLARVIPIGPDFRQLVSVGGTTSGWVGETDARPETASPKLDEVVFPNGEIYANPAVTQRALDDVFFDAEMWVSEKIADEFARAETSAFISGDGLNKPKGLLTYPTDVTADDVRPFGTLQTVNSGAASGLTSDGLIDLIYSLGFEFRGNATWIMNAQTLAEIKKLKDANGDYLWRSGLVEGQPDTLLGRPVVEVWSMPDVAAGTIPIAIGDWNRGLHIGDRFDTRLLRDALTNKPYVQFYTTRRISAMVVNSNAIKLQMVQA